MRVRLTVGVVCVATLGLSINGQQSTHLNPMVDLLMAKKACLLYTSDAADERSSVDLGGRRIIKKKKKNRTVGARVASQTRRNAHTQIQKLTKTTETQRAR